MDDEELDGHLPSITEAIEEAVRRLGVSADLDEVVRAHARITGSHLRGSRPVLGSSC